MNTEDLIHIANNTLLEVTKRPDIIMSHGHGMYISDTEGNRYLDFIGGWAVNCLGHSPQLIVDVLTKQSKTLINASPAFYNIPMLEYSRLLVENSVFDRAFFTSTGAEANEGAIKLARKYGTLFKQGASDIITTRKGFHGRTLTTMAATGKNEWRDLFEPKTTGFPKAVFNDLESVESLVTKNTCAVMLEPIQGEGGVNVGSHEFSRGVRELCDQNNILLIFDEIQTGFGRTGSLFCYEQYNIEPDILTLGKGIGGGFPLSAMLTKDFLNIFDPGDQGGTYTGQPLAMAVGFAVLNELLANNIIDHVKKMGSLIEQKLRGLTEHYEIENIRGKGLLLAFDITMTTGKTFVQKCLEHNLLINSPQQNTIRLMPPLIVSEDDVDKMIRIVQENLKENLG
jgi:acetylornithine/N-succinyldiaminopimelate aminotransferase